MGVFVYVNRRGNWLKGLRAWFNVVADPASDGGV